MPIRLIRLARLFALLACLLGGGLAHAQQQPGSPAAPGTPAASSALTRLEPIRLQLEQIELSARRDSGNDDALATLRGSLDPLRESLRAENVLLQQELTDTDARLAQLGAAPATGAAPENDTIAAERKRLGDRRSDIDAALKQARLLAVRADALIERITEHRRSLFTRQLFVRTASAFDPGFWEQTFQAVPGQWRGLLFLLRSWANYALDTGGIGAIAGAILTLVVLFGAGMLGLRWVQKHQLRPLVSGTRFANAFYALVALIRIAAFAPLVAIVILLVFDSFSLMRPQILELGLGLVGAVAIASFSRGVSVALFAPDEPQRRLPRLDDPRAGLLADHLTIAGRILGVIIFLNMLHRAVVAPVISTVATSALMAAALFLLLIHLLLRLAKFETVAEARGQWLRGAGWIVAAAIIIALATGYVGFAAFISARLAIILAALGALYVLLAFVDSLFSEVLTGDTARGRAVASFFGMKPRSIELIGTLLSATIRVLLILIVIFPLLGPWGIFAADFMDVLREAVFGFRVGDITISLGAIVAAFLLVLVGVFVTRAAQRWLQTRFLPRTSLEPSLQHSVSVIFGYVGVVVALGVALGVLGIDLQKITLVAGALSIGIGFGLQSVVSNFVSGLILLTERPIRVGDMIVVKGEEGFVRRIRVRATEIETFERASVIVPNSELITGVVKNWTHANTLGRIIINVNVSYDSDAEAARDILLAIAREHSQVLQSPPPVALVAGFGDYAIKFELIGVVGNVTQAGSVKSDIYFSILRRFREAGVEIPYPQQEVRSREAPAGPPS